MNVLFLGNSHLNSILAAHRSEPNILGEIGEVNFCMVVGAWGPYVTVEDDLLVLCPPGDDWLREFEPAETATAKVSSFDAIVIGALGFMDGGLNHASAIQNFGVLPEFKPKKEFQRDEIFSDRCMKELTRSVWLTWHEGFKLIDKLRKIYNGRIMGFPSPKLSVGLLEEEEWFLRKCYEDYLDAHAFYTGIQSEILSSLSKEMNFQLVDLPEEAKSLTAPNFNKAMFMKPDGIHADEAHGAMMLRKFAKCLKQEL